MNVYKAFIGRVLLAVYMDRQDFVTLRNMVNNAESDREIVDMIEVIMKASSLRGDGE